MPHLICLSFLSSYIFLILNHNFQNFYHKLKEIQRIQQPEKPKNSFSIDSLAKSASNQSQSPFLNQSTAPLHGQSAAPNPFTMQSQEMYRKALENLNHARSTMTPNIVPTHGYFSFNHKLSILIGAPWCPLPHQIIDRLILKHLFQHFL